jgi:hypothetical protein
MMLLSVVVCIAAFVAVAGVLRVKQVSLGLPIAYLGSLLLIHVPGAVTHLIDNEGLLIAGREFTRIGIGLTAVGSVCFLIGVWLAHYRTVDPVPQPAHRTLFSRFCLIGGAAATILSFMFWVPSIGAVVERGGLIWMLAIMLGLRSATRRGDRAATWKWMAVLLVYPLLTVLLRGFMSYGVAALITVLSALVVTARSRLRVVAGCIVATIVGISIFLSYFEHRGEIRGAVWGGAPVDRRIDVSLDAVQGITLFNPRDPAHLYALDARLNQNYFVGLGAARIASGESHYLRGRTIWEGFLSVIPRALWPDKPIIAGSGRIVADMTGLQLDRNTSFGVGNVMEFHINFGIAGVVVGFLMLGWVLGKLDRLAATSDAKGELGRTLLFFLPAVALIQPNGSMVEMIGGATAAWIAAHGWIWAWRRWPKPTAYARLVPGHLTRPAA